MSREAAVTDLGTSDFLAKPVDFAYLKQVVPLRNDLFPLGKVFLHPDQRLLATVLKVLLRLVPTVPMTHLAVERR